MSKKTPKRKQWDKQSMVLAVKAVRNHEMGYKTASRQFGVPKGTVERYVKNVNFEPEELVDVNLGRKPILGKAIEAELVKYCLDMDDRFFGLRRSDVRRMAFQLALRAGIPHPFSVEKGIAGNKWLRGFLKRHTQLSVRSPQGMSSARIRGFNREQVAHFFEMYEKEFEKIKYDPHRLYNCDETGISVVQHKRSKVVCLKGKKQVSSLTSAERGGLITIVTCMNAVGTYVPPLIIWPRKNMKQELMDGAPTGSIAACHPSGWIQGYIFTAWFDHFVKFTKPTAKEPVVLVLDGHYSHTRNIDVITKARKNNVSIVCLPPHSTHRMQPLDVGFMGPLKTYYAQAIETWLRNNPGRVVTPYVIAGLLTIAYNKSATMEISVNAFRKTGLFPCDPNVFKDHDFAIHIESEEEAENVKNDSDNPRPGTSGVSDNPRPGTSGVSDNPRPGTLRDSNNPGTSADLNEPRIESVAISPRDITPLPKITKKKTSKRAGSAAEESLIKKKKKEEDAAERKARVAKKICERKAKKSNRKRVDSSSSGSSDIDIPLVDDSEDEENHDAECLFCTGLYSEDHHGEEWIQCTKCYRWAHEHCGGVVDEVFVCPICRKNK